MSNKLYREALADVMADAMHKHDNTMIIGQGVNDFKGLFGTLHGLHEKYPSRVIETPIAEDSIAGICLGASLNGMYPINTHIRADFGLLIFNQLINLVAKYKYMFGGLFEVPMMFRFIIGRSWGQGAQHSQSLQSLLAHIPGLVVIMPSSPRAIKESYEHAISKHRGPVVMLEHRLMYELEFGDESNVTAKNPFSSRMIQSGDDVTIVATSVMVLEAKRAAEALAKVGISAEVIDLHSVSDPDHDMIFNSVKKTGRLLTVDTSWVQYGVVSEINRIICERDPTVLKRPSRSLGMAPSPFPTAKALEDIYYPDIRDIFDAVVDLSGVDGETITERPKKQPMTDYYKHFKGPF